MLVYFIVPFLYRQDFTEILKATFIPDVKPDRKFLAILVGILGTTISPYLFFWQASVEVEESTARHLIVNKKLIGQINKDIDFGMAVSGFVMYFIILTAGTVLFKGGINQIDTVQQAALALKPLAGNLAYLLFAAGVIGTGLIAIPVLSGSISYIITETFGWEQGLGKKFHEAKAFYMIIALSLLLGLSLNYMGITPIESLIYTAVLYGLTAPVLIAMILHIANNKKIMGRNVNGWITNSIGFAALIIMTAAAGALVYMQFSQ
jgi:Mn2+/Fe2+ NRAMP family transporter